MDISSKQKVKVFEPKENEKRKNTVSANVSSFEGKDAEGEKQYSSWNANFVGDAFEKAKALSGGEWIFLKRAKIENSYSKEKKRLYVNLTIFDFEIDTGE